MTTLTSQIMLAAKQLRRTLKLSPIQFLFRRLQQSGARLETLTALEAFGGTGVNQTPDLYAAVKQLDIWDVSPPRRAMLQQKFPRAQVTTGDSYQMIQSPPKTYDLVVLDAGERMGDRYEHFEMFPHVFKALKNPGVLIFNETPVIRDTDPKRLRQRKEFYRVDNPSALTWDQIKAAYQRLTAENDWMIEHFFTERRWVFSPDYDRMYYTVLMLRRP